MTTFLIFAAIVVAYLLPALIAAQRQHVNANAIFLVNLLLGWTFLGWVLALVWSATAATKPVLAAATGQSVSEQRWTFPSWAAIPILGVWCVLLWFLLK